MITLNRDLSVQLSLSACLAASLRCEQMNCSNWEWLARSSESVTALKTPTSQPATFIKSSSNKGVRLVQTFIPCLRYYTWNNKDFSKEKSQQTLNKRKKFSLICRKNASSNIDCCPQRWSAQKYTVTLQSILQTHPSLATAAHQKQQNWL